MNPTSNPKVSCEEPTESGESQSVRLVVITGDNCPSFKNRKRSILDSATGKQRTLTPKKIKERMEQITNGLLSALLSECQTIEGATLMGCSRLSWIASKIPADDSLQWIPEIHLACERVEKGKEGFEILIKEIT